TAEHLAQPGQVVLTPDAWALVADRCLGTPLQPDLQETRGLKITGETPTSHLQSLYVRLDAIHAPLPLRRARRPALAPGRDSPLRSFIPGAVLSRLVAGEIAWLAELRRITVLFINLPVIDYATAIEQVQAVVQALQTVLYRYEGSLNKISVDDKGAVLV